MQNILLYIRDTPRSTWHTWVDRVDQIPLENEVIAVGPAEQLYQIERVVGLPQPVNEYEAVMADVYATKIDDRYCVDQFIVAAQGKPVFIYTAPLASD